MRAIAPATAVVGHVAVPGDKSISHRALLLAAVGDGETRIRGWGRSLDTESTLEAVRALGVRVDESGPDQLVVHGAGLHGLQEPDGPIDCGNSGTTVRLLAGLLAGHGGRFELTGDESLCARPMERIAEPLRRMGARVETTDGRAPLVVESAGLHGIEYESPVASAQVKSALLLAGLYAAGPTTVVEPLATRNHTELMLRPAGARVTRRGRRITIQPAARLALGTLDVPGDVSAAAPFVAAACLLPGSELTVHEVGLNPTRSGFLDVLAHMGARLTVLHRRRAGGEQLGDVDVRPSELVATRVLQGQVPLLVDELPLLALVAGMARGTTTVRGAAELRVKETDRIEAVTAALRPLGIHIEGRADGFRVRGVPARPRGGTVVDTRGDHRIAMLGAVAGLVSRKGVRIEGDEAVAVSFPEFFDVVEAVAQRS
ncbi:MAG: 3-phosphoshikimate 1-carboxyvinyltransferase [Gaiellaceae bacterium]